MKVVIDGYEYVPVTEGAKRVVIDGVEYVQSVPFAPSVIVDEEGDTHYLCDDGRYTMYSPNRASSTRRTRDFIRTNYGIRSES